MGAADSRCKRCIAGEGDEELALLQPIIAPQLSTGRFSHAACIVDNPNPIASQYELERSSLGAGNFGTVTQAKCKTTGDIRAVKSIPKAQMGLEERKRVFWEVKIMKEMDHPYIVKLYETFEDHMNIYLVLELCTGGELFDKIIEAKHFTEKQAAHIMMQILSGIFHCHQVGICHRDIKPENFLFQKQEDSIEKGILKLIDFGLACAFAPGQSLKTMAGTAYYVAPEVLSLKYTQACDVWSCGVMMYVLLCGYPPFDGDTDDDVLKSVQRGDLEFDPDNWKGISEDATRLIRMCCQKDPETRYTAGQALEDVWIKDRAPRAANAPLTSGLVSNLRGFRSQNKFKKAALHIIASQLKEEQIEALRDTFMTLDENGDGLLTSAELSEGLKKAGFDEVPADLQQIMETVDSDGSGVIDYTEFLAATIDKKLFMQESVCWSAFRVFDKDGDGTISRDELKAIIGDENVSDAMHHTAETVDELMKEVDTDGDGNIDFKEFMQMMRANPRRMSVCSVMSASAEPR